MCRLAPSISFFGGLPSAFSHCSTAFRCLSLNCSILRWSLDHGRGVCLGSDYVPSKEVVSSTLVVVSTINGAQETSVSSSLSTRGSSGQGLRDRPSPLACTQLSRCSIFMSNCCKYSNPDGVFVVHEEPWGWGIVSFCVPGNGE